MATIVIESWYDVGLNVNMNATSIKTTCPSCSEQRKNKKEKCLSVNPQKGVANCHNCGDTYVIKSENKSGYQPKEYKLPEVKQLPISEKSIAFFKSRGIEERVLEYFKVTESVEWMYAKKADSDKGIPEIKEGNTTCINFNYYDEKQLVNVKFRASGKRFKMSTGAKLIFYNLDAIKNSDECCIQEGEIDTMTAYQCNIFNSISVPNGASKGNQRLEYLDNCIDHFANKKKVIIATDGDSAGMMLRDELIRRIGREICWVIDYPEGTKDTNEVYLKYGPDGVRKMYEQARQLPIEGIVSEEDLENEVTDIYENGYPEGLKIGYKDFDNHITWIGGQITLWTGIPGCLTGDTLVSLSTGERKLIKDIRVGDEVISISDDFNASNDTVLNKWDSGVKRVYEIKTKRGLTINASREHRFNMFDGWKKLSDISVGQFISVQNNIEQSGEGVQDDELKLIALWICDGSKNNSSYMFTNANKHIIAEMFEISERYNLKLVYDGSYSYRLSTIQFNSNKKKYISGQSFFLRQNAGLNFNESVTAAEKRYNAKNGGSSLNPLKLIKDFGLYGVKTNDIFIPESIFRLSNKKIAVLLNYLFSCDGGVVKCGLEYSSNSKRLCFDIKELLSRFGILSILSKKNVLYKGEYRTAWRLNVNGRVNCEIFAQKIGLTGKNDKLLSLLANMPVTESKLSDHVPSTVKKEFLNGDKFYKKHLGVSVSKNDHSKIRFSRALALKVAEHDNNVYLLNKLSGNIVWDEIISITDIGDHETYDIEVSNNHNFIANGILTHNSGKSEFLDQVMVRQSARHGWRHGIFAPENEPRFQAAAMISKFVGGEMIGKGKISEMKKDKGIQFVKEHFFFMKADEIDVTLDGILSLAKELVVKKGINSLLIDPYNYIETKIPAGLTETLYISELMSKLVRFAKTYNIHINLVAHPTKIQKDKNTDKYKVATLYDISGCHDDQTEVLTSRGWIKHEDITPSDTVACYDLSQNHIEYMKPTHYHKYQHKGDLIHFSGRSMDIAVTPNHRMVVKPHWTLKPETANKIGRTKKYNSRDWQFVTADNISKSPMIMPKSAKALSLDLLPDEYPLDNGYSTNHLFSLIGWFVSEGCESQRSISISQRAESSENLKKAVSDLRLQVNERETNYRSHEKPMYTVRVLAKKHPELVKFILSECGHGSQNVELPSMVWDGNEYQKRLLFDAMIEGDGSVSGKGFKYHTCSKRLADDVSRLAFELGFSVAQRKYEKRKSHWMDRYVVYINPKNTEWIMPVNHKSFFYDGFVYCLTVPTGAYVTRRNGNVAITGNSANFYNKTFNGISIYRDYELKIVTAHIQKVKFKWIGHVGAVDFTYDYPTGRYAEVSGVFENELDRYLHQQTQEIISFEEPEIREPGQLTDIFKMPVPSSFDYKPRDNAPF